MSPQDGIADTLLDYTQDMVTVIAEDGTFTYLNRSVERIMGFDPDELVGENAFEYVHADDCERVVETFASVIETTDELVMFADVPGVEDGSGRDRSTVSVDVRRSSVRRSPGDRGAISSIQTIAGPLKRRLASQPIRVGGRGRRPSRRRARGRR